MCDVKQWDLVIFLLNILFQLRIKFIVLFVLFTMLKIFQDFHPFCHKGISSLTKANKKYYKV